MKRLRLERGLAQRTVAEGAEISVNHLQNIEAALVNPGATKVLGLAEALGVTAGDLLEAPTPSDGRRLLSPVDLQDLSAALKTLTAVVERIVKGEPAPLPSRAPRRPRR